MARFAEPRRLEAGMAMRFNPPPGWPPAPDGWAPGPGWQPDPQASENLGPASSTPGVHSSGSISVHALAVGDCFDWPTGSQSAGSVLLIPCGQAHNAQVFAVWELSGSSYPADNELHQVLSQGCLGRQQRLSTAAQSLEVSDIRPSPAGFALGDRKVYCAIVSPTADLKSSLMTS